MDRSRDRLSYFNPLPPHGGRHAHWNDRRKKKYFNPLPPHGGRHAEHGHFRTAWKFQSTPSAWRETFHNPHQDFGLFISIHSLRMEGDAGFLLGGVIL